MENSPPLLVLEADHGWSRPRVKTKSFPRYESLKEYLDTKGLGCNMNGTDLVYIVPMNCWDNLASSMAQVNMTNVADITNATVQYGQAFDAYRTYVTKYCSSRTASLPPTSVNIGTRRLEVLLSLDDTKLTFKECRRLVDMPGIRTKDSDIVASVCYQPLAYIDYPKVYVPHTYGRMVHHLAPLFYDLKNLITVMWMVGNALVDPVARPRTLMLAGSGGTGKSRVLTSIQDSCTGASSAVPVGAMTSTSKDAVQKIMSMAVSSRLLLAYDVNQESSSINLDVIKNLTGGDIISIDGINVKSHCSLLMGTNGLPNATEEGLFATDAIMRRLVIVPMLVNAFEIEAEHAPTDSNSRLDFVCECIRLRLCYPVVPVSARTLVMTISMDKYRELSDQLWFYDEDSYTVNAKPMQHQEAATILTRTLKRDYSTIVHTCGLVSPISLFEYGGEKYIKGILPAKYRYGYLSNNRSSSSNVGTSESGGTE